MALHIHFGSCFANCNGFREWDSNHMAWDTLAFAYSRSEMVHDVLVVLSKIKDLNLQASIMTFNGLLYNLRLTDIVWDVYDEIKASGIPSSNYTNSIIIDSLCRQSSIQEAVVFMHEAEGQESGHFIVWFNNLTTGFCKLGFVSMAKSFFCMMFKYGLLPDRYSYNIHIDGLCIAGSIEEALEFTNDIEKHGLEPDIATYKHSCKSLICCLCKRGGLDEALFLFHEMKTVGLEPDLVIYSILIHGLCKKGQVHQAVQVYKEMCLKIIMPNLFAHRSILLALCEEGTIKGMIVLW